MRWLCLLLITCAVAEDWPSWRGPRGNGISRETGILKRWPDTGLGELWRTPVGPAYSGIAVADDVAYTLTSDNRYEYCVAVDAVSGEKLWRRRLGYLYKDGNGSGPRSTPAIAADKVYAVSAHGEMWCLTTAGERVWHRHLYRDFGASRIKWGVASSPIIYQSLLLYNAGGSDGRSIIALDKETGELKWNCGDDKAAYSTPIIARVHGRDQAIFFTGYAVLGVDLDHHRIAWRSPWETFENIHVSTPIFHDHRVLISSGYNGGAALVHIVSRENRLEAIRERTTHRFKTHFSSSILWQEHVYGFHNGRLQCMNFYDFRRYWSKRGFRKGSLVAADGHLIVFGERGSLALVELNPSKYAEKGRHYPFPRTGRCLAPPALSNGRLFVRNDQELVCLDITSRR